MKSTLFVCLFSLAASALHAASVHPSVLTVKVKDQMLPVVRVVGTDPIVLVDGKEKRIRTDPIYLLQRADAYGPGFIQARDGSLGGQMRIDVMGSNGENSTPTYGMTYFSVPLMSKETLRGGFAAVVVYQAMRSNGSSIPEIRSQIIVHDLPDLPAGEVVMVKFSGAGPTSQQPLNYFTQVFDSTGHEVMTNALQYTSEYYMLRDLIQLGHAREDYLAKNQGADHALVPVLTTKPYFREGLARPTGEVSAILAITDEGQVSKVEVTGVENDEARASISNALGGWLFLPQLKAGRAVATKVKVPLQF